MRLHISPSDDTLDLHESATNLQRKECYNLHNIVIVQAAVRGYLGRQHYKAKVEDKLKKVCCLITKVQACWRCWKLRTLYIQNYRKIITVQSHIRGFLGGCIKGGWCPLDTWWALYQLWPLPIYGRGHILALFLLLSSLLSCSTFLKAERTERSKRQ